MSYNLLYTKFAFCSGLEGYTNFPIILPYHLPSNLADFLFSSNLSSQHDGLASLMGCEKTSDNILTCVGNARFLLEGSMVKLKVEKENLAFVADFLCERFGYGKWIGFEHSSR